MPVKKIVIDGRTVSVDANRHTVFDSAPSRTMIAAALASALLSPQVAAMNRDAGEVLSFMVSQLAYTESQAYEKLYIPMQFREFVPVSAEGGWADQIRYELMDRAGKGKRISGAGRDLPRADVQFGEKLFPVVTGGIGYAYQHEEMQKSAFYRVPLPTARLAAAMEAAERHLNDVALYGEASSGLTGLFNNANVPQGSSPFVFSSSTPDQMLSALNTGIYNVWINTAYNDTVTDILLPPAIMKIIATTPRATGSDKTILQWLKENNLAKVEKNIDINFRSGYGLNTAGVGATTRILFYVRNESRVKMHIPQELQFLAPQNVDLETKVPGVYRYSGVEFRYPKSAYYMDGA